MNDKPFLMGTTSSITMQSLVKIAQCAPAVVQVRKCGVFCWSRSESGAPCLRGLHSSNKHCVAVYCPISTRFSAFFRRHCFFRWATQFSFFASWRHNFSEIAVTNCENPKKSAEKFVRTTSYRQLMVLKKILPHQFRAENVDVHLYKKIFCTSLHSADRKCQISYRQSKNGSE